MSFLRGIGDSGGDAKDVKDTTLPVDKEVDGSSVIRRAAVPTGGLPVRRTGRQLGQLRPIGEVRRVR
jgi:hypothetical protein